MGVMPSRSWIVNVDGPSEALELSDAEGDPDGDSDAEADALADADPDSELEADPDADPEGEPEADPDGEGAPAETPVSTSAQVTFACRPSALKTYERALQSLTRANSSAVSVCV